MENQKLLYLLDVVVENYINKGEPVGSKFLHSLENVEYAPSTLRKYLNLLEKEGLVFQPYNSAGRVPTIKGLSIYLKNLIGKQEDIKIFENFELEEVRGDLKDLVEGISDFVDGVVVGFLRNDEYYFLGINNLVKKEYLNEFEAVKNIIKFIEKKQIVNFLDGKIVKKNQIYYTFIQEGVKTTIATLYTKIEIRDYDAVIAILGPVRIDYKKNVQVLQRLLDLLNK